MTADTLSNEGPMEVSSATRKASMEINAAYESQEKMRRLNLEVECQHRGIVLTEQDYEKCTTYLFQEKKRSLIPFGKRSTPCLICAAPCCTTHRSKSFWQESLVVCCDCEQVFTLDYVVESLTGPGKLQPAVLNAFWNSTIAPCFCCNTPLR